MLSCADLTWSARATCAREGDGSDGVELAEGFYVYLRHFLASYDPKAELQRKRSGEGAHAHKLRHARTHKRERTHARDTSTSTAGSAGTAAASDAGAAGDASAVAELNNPSARADASTPW